MGAHLVTDGANSSWLQLSILAHNLMRIVQTTFDGLATPKPHSRKPTYSYRIASMKTLRFLLINRAALEYSVARSCASPPTPPPRPSTIKSSTALPAELFSLQG